MSRPLAKIANVSLRDQVVGAIRDAIIQGKLRPGEKIPEHDLAEQLGVSRTPIREAIRTLEHQGLVETRPRSGTYVATLRWEEARDSLLVRAALEDLAVRQAIERADPREWDQLCATLQLLLERMRDTIVGGDPIAATELDVEWHTVLIDAARNRYLAHTWRIVGLPFLIWSPERELYPLSQEQWRDVFTMRHERMLAALVERDPDRCGEAVRFHIFEKLHDLIEGIPDKSGDKEARLAVPQTSESPGSEGSV